MQNTLTQRVSALEARQPINEKKTIFIVGVAVGHLNPSINHIECCGQIWTRIVDESEEDFRDRAAREVKRNEWGSAVLLAMEIQEEPIDYAKQ